MKNFWNKLMETEEGAGNYMLSYGEGPGSVLRQTIGSFILDGESVLDAGCGPGWNFDHFMQFGPAISKYKGTDYADLFVKAANKRVMEVAGTSSGPFEVGDIRKLDEPDESWDVVIMQDCIEHTNGFEKPITEALRVAKERVILTFWHLTENDDHINDDGDDGWGAWYSKPKLEEFLDKTGVAWMNTTLTRQAVHTHDIYVLDKQENGRIDNDK